MAVLEKRTSLHYRVASGMRAWHLCSLDAPTIAITWSLSLARIGGIQLSWQELAVLGLGTWIVYVLDRVLDGLPACIAGAARIPVAGPTVPFSSAPWSTMPSTTVPSTTVPSSTVPSSTVPSSTVTDSALPGSPFVGSPGQPHPASRDTNSAGHESIPWLPSSRVTGHTGGSGAFLALEGNYEGGNLQERHLFHRRHRRIFLGLAGTAAILLCLLCHSLPATLVRVYLLLALPVCGYALRVHGTIPASWLASWLASCLGSGPTSGPVSGPSLQAPNLPASNRARRDPPAEGQQYPRVRPLLGNRKEAAVALLFTSAVAAPVLTALPAGKGWPTNLPALLPFRALLPVPSLLTVLAAALLLAILCWLNCAFISLAESPVASSDPLQTRQLTLTAGALAITAGLGSVLYRCFEQSVATAQVTASLLLSSFLLLGLLLGLKPQPASRADSLQVRVMADLALLTPLLFLLIPR